MITNDDDPYRWAISPGNEHLFEKHLSKLSIGPLTQLCREVGTGFYAEHPGPRHAEQDTSIQSVRSEELCELQSKSDLLSQELEKWRARAEKAEQQTEQLGRAFLSLKQDEARSRASNVRLTAVMTRFLQDIAMASPALGLAIPPLVPPNLCA